ARSLDDLTVLLQVLDAFDCSDPRSRRRRVPLALPDWEPGALRSGVVSDLGAIGAEADVGIRFDALIDQLAPVLGHREPIALAGYALPQLRRAALLMMEAGIALADPADL